MDNKYRKIYVEWWKIRKSTIYGLVVFVVLLSAAIYGAYWVLNSNWLSQIERGELPRGAARIISFEGDVRITRAATRETVVVSKQVYAAAGDTIQTQADGRAVLEMIDGSIFSVRPNSTLVIRDNSSLFGGQNIRVALDDGQLNVRTQDQADNTQNVVEMFDSETRLRSQTDASFNTDTAQQGGEIRISRGSVETVVGGQRTTIKENEFAALDNKKITSRETLLLPPKPVTPSNASQIADSGNGVSVSFLWEDSSSPAASTFHIQVARSSYFAADSILVDRASLSSRDFRLAGVSPGTYYWRLKGTTRSGQTSDWSEPSRFNVVRAASSGSIEVSEWNVERVGGNVFILSGKTRSGLLIRTQGREVFAGGDGAFRMQVSSSQNELPVEVMDDRGNRTGFVLSLRNGRVVRRF